VIRWSAFAVACVDLFQVLGLILAYSQANVSTTSTVVTNAPNSAFLFNEQLSWIPSVGINYSLGVDGISLLLVALTALLTLVCIGASFRTYQSPACFPRRRFAMNRFWWWRSRRSARRSGWPR